MAKSSTQTPKTKPLQRISFSEFKSNQTDIKIGNVLDSGFRMWMKTFKLQSLNARTFKEWESLFNEYLKASRSEK